MLGVSLEVMESSVCCETGFVLPVKNVGWMSFSFVSHF